MNGKVASKLIIPVLMTQRPMTLITNINSLRNAVGKFDIILMRLAPYPFDVYSSLIVLVKYESRNCQRPLETSLRSSRWEQRNKQWWPIGGYTVRG